MSFQEIRGFGDVEFIGLKNYSNLFNPHFFNALKVSTKYTFWSILVLVPLPIILAVLLNKKTTIGRNFFKSVFFLPILTSVIVAGIFFRLAFGEQETTFINFFLSKFGFHPIAWLHGEHTSMFVLVLLCSWRWLGINIIYFLAGLQAIPQELYEAASCDGANELQKFIYITIPGLRNIIIFVLIISVHYGYAMFTESYALWGGMRSPGEIGMTLVGYIYQVGLHRNNLGFGSAIGIVLLLIVMTINTILLSRLGFFQEGE